MGHRVTVNLDESPENKTYQDLQAGFPCLCSGLLYWGGDQIDPLRGLSENTCLQTGLFASVFSGIAEQSSDKQIPPPPLLHRRITHRCSLRARRTRHPSLAGAALQERKQKKNKLPSFTEIEVARHYRSWQPLPWFQEYQVCHLFHQYPADPEKASRWVSGHHLAHSLNTAATV